jgi:polar amino acid transport system ATP-binding protein
MTRGGSLAVRGVSVTRGATPILRGVDLDVAPGEICVLMGTSGAGKSTVLRAIVALQPFDAGEIRVGDVRLVAGPVPSQSSLGALRESVGMVFQGHALFDHLTALDNVTLAPIHVTGRSRTQAESEAMALLETLGIASRARAYPRQLSGGEAQRVAIARALARDPALLVMDEPTSALDPARRGALAESLRVLANTGRGLLIATHDVEFARACADRVVVLEGGVVARCSAAECL